MDFHHRKLLSLKKIDSSNKTEASEDKKKDPCDPPCVPYCVDDCKGDLDVYDFPPPPPLPPPPPSPTHNSSSILVLVLCILGIAFILVSYFSIVRYRLRNSRRRNSLPVNESREDFIDENHGPVVDHPIWYIRTVGLQQSVIDSIDVFKYKRDEGLVEGTDCSVCLSEFEEDESLRLLPKCGHAFHIHCIDTWLTSHKNCPLCRAPIVNDANSGQVNAGETNLDSSISVGENEILSVENHGHEMERGDEVEENGVAEMSVRDEIIGSFPSVEEKYDVNSSYHQPARKNAGRVKSDLASYRVKLEEEMEPVRRSVSLDISSASMVYYAVANNCAVEGEGSSNTKDRGCSIVQMERNGKQNQEMVLKTLTRNSSIYKLMKSSSLGRSLQKVPLSMKRSFSSTGKSSIPKHSRIQD